MEEQRAIAEYINMIDGGDYEILDFSQKEQHPMKGIHTNSSKIIITNMQEIGLAPYCELDGKATVTLEDKIEWFNKKIDSTVDRHEGKSLIMINMLRDSFFKDKKVICGMHPRFFDKMEYMPYYNYIDDWLSYVVDKVKFNESPEFTQCLPIASVKSNNEVQVHDMIFVFNNKVVRWPDFNGKSQYTEEECIEKLSQLPEISFPREIQNGLEKDEL